MKNHDNSTPIARVSTAKKAFNALGFFCATGFIAIMLGILIGNLPSSNFGLAAIFLIGGYLLIAAPMMMTFMLKVGIFVDVGPMFSYSDVPIGNFIYRTVVRDHSAEAALGIGFTLIKLFLIFFVSLILTPLVTLAVYLCYKKNRKAAIAYAKENDIDEGTIPHINKTFIYITILLVVALFIAAVIGSSISSTGKKQKEAEETTEYSELFNEAIANLPTEYYAYGYKGTSPSGGIISEFMIGDVKVCYGEIPYNFDSDFEGLSSGTKYYIINGEVYVYSYGTGSYELNNTQGVKDYLTGRHLSYWVGDDAKCTDYVTYKSEGKVALFFESGSKEYSMKLDNNDKIIELFMYTESDTAYESIFKLDDTFDLTEIKATAQELVNR